ncbi:aryl hydrocarbon receptor 2 [Brienomyrus brachyistius]|uniref:aryl hydrocarbon receptor 2 n=1 Tax=Brienomyrus brachyistius TaxID=42636 RepID=UPI0020B1D6AC|nr:aryl hydrocarbon receptor 2 [Brienomyrus brachyistius]
MSGSVGIYAAKKRKKPVQKIPKPPPPDGVKSNPSKRHRDRLNGELDKLTSLLPFSEDVQARLDKLSVLRLSVGYLKVKSFFNATIKKNSLGWMAGYGTNGTSASTIDGVSFSEGELLLQALNGFVLVVTAEGYVFYASPTVQDYLGFHQSDVVHQSVYDLIHTDDRAMFRRQLHFALDPTQFDAEQGSDGMQSPSDINTNVVTFDPQHIPPENTSFLERSFCCRFRCLLDNSSGFLALNFQGRLKYLHGQNKMTEDGTMAHPQLGLFVIATPLQAPSITMIRSKTLIFQTKHKLDFTPLGIDPRGKVVLGYNEIELCMKGSGYQFIHAADMMYCADNHIRMIKTGESGLTVFRLLTKTRGWIWVQANARLVFKGGRPDFIVARQRALTNEEGEENLRQRKMQLPFNFATGEAVLYDTSPTLDIQGSSKTPRMNRMPDQKALDPDSILGSMLKQDQSVYHQPSESETQFPLDKAFMDSHALFNVPSDNWHLGNQKSTNEDVIIKDMMETLEQILGDNNMCITLQEMDVDAMEMKDWENTLLRMNTNNSDMSVELKDILTNDIFNYVEEELFKQKGESPCVSSSEQVSPMDDINNLLAHQNTFLGASESLTAVELPAPMLHENQGLSPQNQAVTDPKNGFIGLSGQSLVNGMQNFTHLRTPIPLGINGPTSMEPALQKTPPESVFAPPVGYSQGSTQNNLVHNNIMSFGPCSTVSCAQAQSRPGLPNSQALMNGLGPCSQKQAQIPAQGFSSPVAPHLQGHLQAGILSQQPHFRQHNNVNQPNDINPSQWGPTMPSANFTDQLEEACPPNVSIPDNLIDPSPVVPVQGHLSLQTQNVQVPRLQSWPAPMGKHPPSCYSQKPGFKSNCVTGHQTLNGQNCQTGFRLHKTTNGVYPALGRQPVDTLSPSTSSCMFQSGPAAPSNKACFNNMGRMASAPTCPPMNKPHDHSQQHGCYYFQMSTTDPLAGTSSLPQNDINMGSLTCSHFPGISPDGMITQQQYLT